MERKVLLIEARSSCSCSDHYCDDGNVLETTELNSTLNVAERFAGDFANDFSAMKALLANPAFAKTLDLLGYREIDKLEDVAQKVKLGTRYYAYEGYTIKEVDLTKLDGRFLASNNTLLLQSLEKTTLRDTCPKAYREMLAQRKRLDTIQANKEKYKAERQERKKLKRIEAAKKLLAETGE